MFVHQVRLKLPTCTRTARQHRGLYGESSKILFHWYQLSMVHFTSTNVLTFLVNKYALTMHIRYLTTRCTAWTTYVTPVLGPWALPWGSTSILENYIDHAFNQFQIDHYPRLGSCQRLSSLPGIVHNVVFDISHIALPWLTGVSQSIQS